jgi:hypothetical protein
LSAASSAAEDRRRRRAKQEGVVARGKPFDHGRSVLAANQKMLAARAKVDLTVAAASG